jgi:hypothetical protein
MEKYPEGKGRQEYYKKHPWNACCDRQHRDAKYPYKLDPGVNSMDYCFFLFITKYSTHDASVATIFQISIIFNITIHYLYLIDVN